jgi:hypothetical protein
MDFSLGFKTTVCMKCHNKQMEYTSHSQNIYITKGTTKCSGPYMYNITGPYATLHVPFITHLALNIHKINYSIKCI